MLKIRQSAGLGDILLCLKIATYFQGEIVYWPVVSKYLPVVQKLINIPSNIVFSEPPSGTIYPTLSLEDANVTLGYDLKYNNMGLLAKYHLAKATPNNWLNYWDFLVIPPPQRESYGYFNPWFSTNLSIYNERINNAFSSFKGRKKRVLGVNPESILEDTTEVFFNCSEVHIADSAQWIILNKLRRKFPDIPGPKVTVYYRDAAAPERVAPFNLYADNYVEVNV